MPNFLTRGHRHPGVLLILFCVSLFDWSSDSLAAPAPSATLTEWKLPYRAERGPGSDRKLAYSELCGCVYYSAYRMNRIGRVDLATNTVTEWELPDERGGPFFLLPTADGKLYFSIRGNAFGRLDPVTGAITQWMLPVQPDDRGGFGLYELDQDTAGTIWIMGNTNHKLYRFDPASDVVTIYPIAHHEPYSTNLRIDGRDRVWWLGSRDTNSVAMLDPNTHLYTEWSNPTWVRGSPEASDTGFPKGLSIDAAGRVFFAQKDGNKFTRLNPDTNRITEWPLPTVVPSPPGLFGPPSAGVQEIDAAPGHKQFFLVETNADKIARIDIRIDEILEWPLPPSAFPDVLGGVQGPLDVVAPARDEIFYVTAGSATLGRLIINP
ncbi:Vgb family protein [Methylotetracoccus oryzae]|uniref:Vgb family protein n=1 Tax=Methylotetracoccus oryzae TaxID=1919059 RepID=UPI0013A550CE|nr:SMP-30/gluconolactonase/LRE family protein [Methylotetracoccus oryzae]